MAYSRIHENAGQYLLSFACTDLPADPVVLAAGHEPTGYFWEGIATFLAPDIVAALELDSDTGTFRAGGLRGDLEELRTKLESVITRPAAMRSALANAESVGFELHD